MAGRNANPIIYSKAPTGGPGGGGPAAGLFAAACGADEAPARSFLLPILRKSDLPAGGALADHSKTESAAESSNEPATEASPFTAEEVFNLIRRINDPEHPLTLEQLNVVQLGLCAVDDARSRVQISFTPTIPHCSMATLIGLSITTKLMRSLPQRFKISVGITPGTHNQENEVNKQLADKERVAAALENSHLLRVVNGCIRDTDGALP
eukprot:g2582.t1